MGNIFGKDCSEPVQLLKKKASGVGWRPTGELRSRARPSSDARLDGASRGIWELVAEVSCPAIIRYIIGKLEAQAWRKILEFELVRRENSGCCPGLFIPVADAAVVLTSTLASESCSVCEWITDCTDVYPMQPGSSKSKEEHQQLLAPAKNAAISRREIFKGHEGSGRDARPCLILHGSGFAGLR